MANKTDTTNLHKIESKQAVGNPETRQRRPADSLYLDLEDHLYKAMRLSEALNLATHGMLQLGSDDRFASALVILSDEVSHHTISANKLWHEEDQKRYSA